LRLLRWGFPAGVPLIRWGKGGGWSWWWWRGEAGGEREETEAKFVEVQAVSGCEEKGILHFTNSFCLGPSHAVLCQGRRLHTCSIVLALRRQMANLDKSNLLVWWIYLYWERSWSNSITTLLKPTFVHFIDIHECYILFLNSLLTAT
jgi:hypothetical protein